MNEKRKETIETHLRWRIGDDGSVGLVQQLVGRTEKVVDLFDEALHNAALVGHVRHHRDGGIVAGPDEGRTKNDGQVAGFHFVDVPETGDARQVSNQVAERRVVRLRQVIHQPLHGGEPLRLRLCPAGLNQRAVEIRSDERVGQLPEKGFHEARDDVDVVPARVRRIEAVKAPVERVGQGVDGHAVARHAVHADVFHPARLHDAHAQLDDERNVVRDGGARAALEMNADGGPFGSRDGVAKLAGRIAGRIALDLLKLFHHPVAPGGRLVAASASARVSYSAAAGSSARRGRRGSIAGRSHAAGPGRAAVMAVIHTAGQAGLARLGDGRVAGGRPIAVEGETAHASPLGAVSVSGAVRLVSLPDEHHLAAAVAGNLAVLLVAAGGVLFLLEAVQPEDHVVVVLALQEVLAEPVGGGQPEDVLPLRVVNGHLDGASAKVYRHVFRAAAASVGVGWRRRALFSEESHLARADARPHLSPRAIRRAPAVDDRLLDVEPSFSAGRRLIRTGRLVLVRRVRRVLGSGRHLVAEKGAELLDAVRRMRATAINKKQIVSHTEPHEYGTRADGYHVHQIKSKRKFRFKV